MEASHCHLDGPVPEWEEEWLQRSSNWVWHNSVWGRTACGPGEKKRRERAPPRVQTSKSEDGCLKIVMMSRRKRTSSVPDGSQPVSEACEGHCEGTVQQLDRGETPSLIKGEVYRTTAEDSAEDHAKAGRDPLEAGHQNLLLEKKISELQQFSEEVLKPEEEDKMLGDVNALNSSWDGDHHLAETVQSSVLRRDDLTQQITEGTDKRSGLLRNFNHKKEYTYTTLHWHHSAVASLCFTPEGTNLLSGGVESVLVQWKYRENQRDFLPRLGAAITHVAVSPDGALFCCSHSDNKITIIQNCVNVSAVIQGLVRGESARTDLMVDPRTKCLVLNGNPGHLQFYSLQRDKLLYNLDIVQQEFIHELGLQQFEVVNAAFDGPGNWLATVEERRRKAAELELNLKLWAFDEQTQSFVLNTTIVAPHDSQVTDLCFCRASDSQTTLLVSASKDGHFKAWQLAAQTEVNGSDNQSFPVRGPLLLGSGQPLFYKACYVLDRSLSSSEPSVHLSPGSPVPWFTCSPVHLSPICMCVAYGMACFHVYPEQTHADMGRTCKLHKEKNLTLHFSLILHPPTLTPADGGPSWSCDFVGAYRGLVPECCCFSADGSLLAVSFQEVVTVWSPGSWELLTTLSQPPKSIRNLCFGRLSCSKYLVGTAGNNLLCCWNLLTCSLEWSTSMEVTLLLADPHSDNMAAFCWQDKCTDLFVFKPSEPRPLFSHKAVCSGKVSRAVFAPREEMLESCEESSQWLNRSQLCFLTQNMDLMTFTTETEEEKLMASSKQLVIDDSVAMTPFYLLLGKHRCQTLEMRDKESSWGSAERTPLPKGSVAVKELLQTPAHVLPPTSVLCAMFVESLLVSVTDSREEDEPEEEEMEGESEEDSEENVALRAEPAPLGREMVDSAPLTKAQTRELRRLVKLDHGWFSDLLDS
ncbi:WD repeat-containing protein 75 [Takifugu flavidus]|uniref:WD repeat-containing protein 75 n=1 Tax=Takifugu flavidus TaxID=433684 RepID=A0A5C6PNL9_9TELE|nr:WD repeat-containing protein 75 [Takifugu flavidus]